jgi:hypothetical protein
MSLMELSNGAIEFYTSTGLYVVKRAVTYVGEVEEPVSSQRQVQGGSTIS